MGGWTFTEAFFFSQFIDKIQVLSYVWVIWVHKHSSCSENDTIQNSL